MFNKIMFYSTHGLCLAAAVLAVAATGATRLGEIGGTSVPNDTRTQDSHPSVCWAMHLSLD